MENGRLTFFLGAGASVAARMPSTAIITERLLNGDGIHRGTNENYFIGEDPMPDFSSKDVYVPRVCEFLLILKDLADQTHRCGKYELDVNATFYHLFGRHETNYEDLYYVAKQLYDSDRHEYENPALEPTLQYFLNHETVRRLREPRPRDYGTWEFSTLCKETCLYIEGVVSELLSVQAPKPEAYSLLVEAAKDESLGSVNIVTLNHDTVIEKLFLENSITYCDGFTDARGSVRYWNNESLRNLDRNQILKLHGSIDWYYFHSDTPRWRSERVGICETEDCYHARDEFGNLMGLGMSNSIILLGTFNKILSYSVGIFGELNDHFHNLLRQTSTMIVCGYGFGDKVVNTKLLDWIHSDNSHRAVIIDPALSKMNDTVRGAVRSAWPKLKQDKRLIFIEEGLETVDWTRLKQLIY